MKEDSEHIRRKQIELEERLRKVRSAVQAAVVSRTPDDWDREEIVSKAEDRVREKMRSTNWTVEITNVLAYEKKIAKRIIIDTWRRYGDYRWNSFDDDLRPQAQERLVNHASQRSDLGLNVETKIYLQELAKSIPWETLLKGVTGYEKGLIEMHYVDGMKFRDIGDAIGKEAPVVKYDLERAIAKIRYRATCYLKEKGLTSLFKREG